MATPASAVTSLPDKVMDGLSAARASLESSSDTWSTALEVATLFVVIGVVIEVIATWLEVRDEKLAGHKIKLHHVLTFVGAGIIALAVAAEFWAEYEGIGVETALRGNNASAQTILTERANTATADAVALTKSFGGLHDFVSHQESLNSAAVGELRRSTAGLNKARDDALAAADGTKKDLAQVATLLAQESALRQRIAQLTTPRVMSEAQISALADSLKKYPKTPFDLFVTNDPDSTRLVGQIGLLLEQAGWTWEAAPTIGDINWSITGKPAVGLVTVQGFSIEIAESSQPMLEKPAVALRDGLLANGIAVTDTYTPDDKIGKAFDHAVMHIFVGTR